MSRSRYRPASRRLMAARGGATAAEFAIIFPFFFMLMFGTFEFARLMWAANTLQYVVSQAARYAMTSGTSMPTASNCSAQKAAYGTSVQTYLTAQLATYLPSAPAPSVTVGACTTSPATVPVTIHATYQFDFILPGFMPWIIPTLTQTATVTTPLS